MFAVGFLFLFWPLFAYLVTGNRRAAFGILLATLLICSLNTEFFFGERTVSHWDTLGGLLNFYEVNQLVSHLGLFKSLSAWNPYSSGGDPFRIQYYPWFHFFLRLNLLSPMPLKEAMLFNCYVLNTVIGLCTGMWFCAFLITRKHLVAFLTFVSCLFGNLLLTSCYEEVSRWLFFLPFGFAALLMYLEEGKAFALFLAVTFIALSLTTYLPNGVVLGVGVFACFFAKQLLSRKVPLRTWVLSLLVAVFAVSPILFLYQEQKNIVRPARGYTEKIQLEENRSSYQEEILVGHPAYFSDFLSLVADTPTSREYHVWNYAGPFLAYFALFGFFFGWFRKRNRYALALGCASIVLFAYSRGNLSVFYPLFVRIPIFNFMRHYLFIYSYAFFFLVLLGAIGVAEWLEFIQRPISAQHRFSYLLFTLAYGGLYFVSRDLKVPLAAVTLLSLYAFSVFSRSKEKIEYLSVGVLVTVSVMLLLPYQKRVLAEISIPTPAFDYKPIVVPTERDCVAIPGEGSLRDGEKYPKIFHWELRNKRACITHSTAMRSAEMAPRINELLNVIYPSRNRISYLNKDLSQILYNHGEPILGHEFPLYFFTTRYRTLSHDEHAIEEMVKSYREVKKTGGVPEVFLFKEDALPDLTEWKKNSNGLFKPLQLDRERSTLSDIYLTVEAPQNGFLVRLENYHPEWSVEINGVPKKVFRGNYAFQMIPLEKGLNSIHFSIRSKYAWVVLAHQVVFYLGFFLLLYFCVQRIGLSFTLLSSTPVQEAVFLFAYAVICWGQLFSLEGLWWDDWQWVWHYWSSTDRSSYVQTFFDQLHPLSGYIHYYLCKMFDFIPTLLVTNFWHGFSFVIHFLNSLLFCRLLRNLGLGSISFFVALFYLGMPINDLFLMTGIHYEFYVLLYLLSFFLQNPSPVPSPKGYAKKGVSLLFAFAALLNLESLFLFELLRLPYLRRTSPQVSQKRIFNFSLVYFALWSCLVVRRIFFVKPQGIWAPIANPGIAYNVPQWNGVWVSIKQSFYYLFFSQWAEGIQWLERTPMNLLTAVALIVWLGSLFLFYRKLIELPERKVIFGTLIFALIAIAFGVFPYAVVSKVPFKGILARYALLSRFGFSAFVIAIAILFGSLVMKGNLQFALFDKRTRSFPITVSSRWISLGLLGGFFVLLSFLAQSTIETAKSDWVEQKYLWNAFTKSFPCLPKDMYVLFDVPRTNQEFFGDWRYYELTAPMDLLYRPQSNPTGVANLFAEGISHWKQRGESQFIAFLNQETASHVDMGGVRRTFSPKKLVRITKRDAHLISINPFLDLQCTDEIFPFKRVFSSFTREVKGPS